MSKRRKIFGRTLLFSFVSCLLVIGTGGNSLEDWKVCFNWHHDCMSRAQVILKACEYNAGVWLIHDETQKCLDSYWTNLIAAHGDRAKLTQARRDYDECIQTVMNWITAQARKICARAFEKDKLNCDWALESCLKNPGEPVPKPVH